MEVRNKAFILCEIGKRKCSFIGDRFTYDWLVQIPSETIEFGLDLAVIKFSVLIDGIYCHLNSCLYLCLSSRAVYCKIFSYWIFIILDAKNLQTHQNLDTINNERHVIHLNSSASHMVSFYVFLYEEQTLLGIWYIVRIYTKNIEVIAINWTVLLRYVHGFYMRSSCKNLRYTLEIQMSKSSISTISYVNSLLTLSLWFCSIKSLKPFKSLSCIELTDLTSGLFLQCLFELCLV